MARPRRCRLGADEARPILVAQLLAKDDGAVDQSLSGRRKTAIQLGERGLIEHGVGAARETAEDSNLVAEGEATHLRRREPPESGNVERSDVVKE